MGVVKGTPRATEPHTRKSIVVVATEDSTGGVETRPIALAHTRGAELCVS